MITRQLVRGENYTFSQHQTSRVQAPVGLVALTGPNWRFAEDPDCLNVSCLLCLMWHVACFYKEMSFATSESLWFTGVGADCPCLHHSLLSSLPSTATPGDLTCPSPIFKYVFQGVTCVGQDCCGTNVVILMCNILQTLRTFNCMSEKRTNGDAQPVLALLLTVGARCAGRLPRRWVLYAAASTHGKSEACFPILSASSVPKLHIL